MAKRNEEKEDSKSSNRTVFICHAPDAESVFLAGTFNDWDPASTAMERGEGGTWRTELGLDPGHYEYKFVINGMWCCEPGQGDETDSRGCVPNSFGTLNRVIEVSSGGTVVEVGFSVARPSASIAS